jgi:hypothetical protein
VALNVDDPESTDAGRYAGLSDEALVSVLRPTSTHPLDAEDLSRGFPADGLTSSNYLNCNENFASHGHLTWNRTWDWLREVEGLRQGLSSGSGTDSEALSDGFAP